MSVADHSDRSPDLPVVAVVGVGLIGGSFAAALRRAGAARQIIGVGRREATLARAQQLGLIDTSMPLAQAAEQADVILLAAPVRATEAVLKELAPHLRDGTVVTDAGSTKSDVVAMARRTLGDRVSQFIPGHPIAGAETTGPEAADPALYQGRNVVLTPLSENASEDKLRIVRLWETCGARVLMMDPEAHDKVLASVSHIPHLLASVFMWQVASADDADRRLGLAGSGFRDFTRIAAGSAEVWRDIFLSNRSAVLEELQEVKQALAHAEAALRDSDGPELEAFLEKAALARRFWQSRSGLL